jgi:hypothetical protein
MNYNVQQAGYPGAYATAGMQSDNAIINAQIAKTVADQQRRVGLDTAKANLDKGAYNAAATSGQVGVQQGLLAEQMKAFQNQQQSSIDQTNTNAANANPILAQTYGLKSDQLRAAQGETNTALGNADAMRVAQQSQMAQNLTQNMAAQGVPMQQIVAELNRLGLGAFAPQMQPPQSIMFQGAPPPNTSLDPYAQYRGQLFGGAR